MPLSNISTSFTQDLIPAYVVDLDSQHLIEAVLAGYTDRLADLRSLASRYSTLVEANPAPYVLVIATVQTSAGPVVNRVLDIKSDTPVDPGDALNAWVAQQLGVEPSAIRAAVFGTDAYRTTSIDSVQLLASTLGATLYHPVITGSPDLSRFSLATFFPRLKLRGTPAAFDVLGRLYGFDEAKMTPLWSRLAPHDVGDPGAAANEQDFSATADTPPEVTGEYDPRVKNDGPYYTWVSNPVSILATDANYVARANGESPFVRVVTAASVIRVPSAGTVQLSGGADGVYAEAELGGGFKAYAIDRGASFNGMQVRIAPLSGTTFQLEVTWPLSLIKYRSSYYDLALTSDHPATIPAAANVDLRSNPRLTADGTAISPWTPWSGKIPRIQAPAGTLQVDTTALGVAASAVTASLLDVSAATRHAHSVRYGVSARDTIGYAPYPGIVSGYGTATFAVGCITADAITGTIDDGQAVVQASGTIVSFGSGISSGTIFVKGDWFVQFPNGIKFYASASTYGEITTYSASKNDSPEVELRFVLADDGFWYYQQGEYDGILYTSYYRGLDTDGTPVGVAFQPYGSPPGSLPAPTVTAFTSGTINLGTGSISAPGSSFKLQLPRSLDCAPAGATPDAARLYYDRPLETVQASGTFQSELVDDYPWLRPLVAGGAPVDTDSFFPEYGDANPTPVGDALCVRTTSQVNVRPVVRDYTAVNATRPFGYRIQPTDDQRADTSYALRDGQQVAVIASNGFIFDAGRWSAALHSGLLAWVPLADHVDETPIDVRTAAGSAAVTFSGIKQSDRYYTAAGWALKLNCGCSVVAQSQRDVASVALRVVTSGGTGVLVTVGDTVITVTRTTYTFDVGDERVTLARPPGIHLIGFSKSDTSTTVFAGVQSTVVQVVDTPAQQVRIDGVGSTVQDLLVWRYSKTPEDIDAAYTGRAAASPCQLPPLMSSIHGKRYALEVNLASGFCSPSSVGQEFKRRSAGREVRYSADGGYTGDPRFELVGLGQSSPNFYRVTLGLEGLEMAGDGTVVSIDAVSSAYPGAPLNFPSYPPLAGINAVVGHFDTRQETGGSVRARLISTGSSVVYDTSPIIRTAGTRVVNHATGALGAAFNFGSTLVADGSGQLVYGLGTAGTRLQSPAAYLYLHEEPALSLSVYSAWINKNPYGTAIGKAALDADGELLFSMTTALQAGRYAIDVSSHNDGVLDSAFEGFDTELTLELETPVIIPAVLQPEASGASPSGVTRVTFTLTSATASSWVLRLRWFNARTLPAKGQTRRLVIDGISVQRQRSRVFSATLPPVEQVNPPGAYVNRINSYGTTVSSVHESQLYGDVSVRSLANGITGSTSRRNEFHTGSTFQLPTPAEIPALTSVYYAASVLTPLGFDGIQNSIWTNEDEVNAICMEAALVGPINIGDIVRFSGSATGGVGPLRYIVNIASAGRVSPVPGRSAVVSGYSPTLEWCATIDGTHEVEMRAIDQYGNNCVLSGSTAVVVVNTAPGLQISAIPSLVSRRAPFTLALTATTQAIEADSPVVSWYVDGDGTAFSTGYSTSLYVTRDCSVTSTVTTNSGATSTMTLPFVTRPGRPPAVSLEKHSQIAYAAKPKQLTFRAVVADQDFRGLVSSTWNFWDGSTDAGVLHESAPGLYYADITKNFGAGLSGSVGFSFEVVDSAGRKGTAASQVEMVYPSAPVIDIAIADSYEVPAGTLATFRCTAHSPVKLGLTTKWVFSNGFVAFGTVVSVYTAGMSGGVLGAVVSVTDSAGESTVADIRQVQVT